MAEPISNYHDNVRRDIFALLPEKAGRVLDFGGGVGATAAALRDEGRAQYVVVADQIDDTLPSVDVKIATDLDDAARIAAALAPYGQFDTILCLDILEHLRDPWEVLGTLYRCLAPGGTVLVSVPNVNYRGIVMPLLFKGSWQLEDGGPLDRTHLRWFTRHSLRELVERAGLTVERIEGTIAGRSRLLNSATLGLFERFLSVQYVVQARKA